MIQKYGRGSIWWYNFGDADDNEENITYKRRPCVVVSNNQNNLNSNVVIVAPITTHKQSDCRPWQVYFYSDRDQVIQCEQLKSVNKKYLTNYDGQLDEVIMRQVDAALALQLDIPMNEKDKEATTYLERFDKSIATIIDVRLKDDEAISKSYLRTILDEQRNYQNSLTACINKLIGKNINEQNTEILNKLNEIEALRKNHDDQLCKILSNLSKLMTTAISKSDIAQNRPNSVQNEQKNKLNDNSKSNINRPNKQENEPKKKPHHQMSQIKKFNAKWNKPIGITEPQTITETITKVKEDKSVSKLGGAVSHHRTPHKTHREATDYDDVKACLAFLYECQDLTMTELCEKYKLTEKQISNKKYLICKSLQDKKIEYPNVRIRRN